MSFRVRYAVGNTANRDHQFWPTAPGIPEDLSGLSLSLASIMQMAWRVREWTVSAGSFSWSGTDPLSTLPWTMEGEWEEFVIRMKRVISPLPETDVLRDVVNEQDILGPPFALSEFGLGGDLSLWPTLRNGGITGMGEVEGIYRYNIGSEIENENAIAGRLKADLFATVTGQTLFGGFVLFNSGNNEFVPYATVGLDANSTLGILEANAHVFSFSGPADMDSIADVSFAVPGGGSSLIQGQFMDAQHENGDPGGSGTISDITVTPSLWWPYANSNGDPVYDTTSGAELVNPFS